MNNITMFPTLGAEYLVTVVFVIALCFFWRYLSPAEEKAPSGKRLAPGKEKREK